MATWLQDLLTATRGSRGATYGALIKRYDAYLQLLRANNDFLELLAEVESMSSEGGTSGWHRLRNAVTRLNVQVFAMAKMLGHLSEGRYDELFPVIEGLGRAMQGRLDAQPDREADGPALIALENAPPDREDLLGGKTANLVALREPGGPLIPPGIAITTSAFRGFLSHNGLDETARMLWDTLDENDPAHMLETSLTLKEGVLAGALPPPLQAQLLHKVGLLAARLPPDASFAVRSSANGEDSAFSFAGQYETVLRVPPAGVPEAVIRVYASFFNPAAVMLRLRRGYGAHELGMGVLVLAMVEGRVSGVAYSRDPAGEGAERVLVEAVPGLGRKLVDGTVKPSGYTVNRSDAAPPAAGAAGSDTRLAEEQKCGGARELLSPLELHRIVALALATEARLGVAADVEWTLDRAGELWLIQARPMALRPAPRQAGAALPGQAVLLEGGTPASAGASAGPVAHVRCPQDTLGLPAPFVAVAAEATPDLALLLPRACALVTERGGAASHLAAVAREFGIPAVFGLGGALSTLAPGEVVTVDGTSGRVYGGRVEPLLEAEGPETRLPPAPGPVRDALQDLLPLILPLHLLDPAAPEFAPSGCLSLHDVVRFVHEKALAEMVGLPDAIGGRVDDAGVGIQERLPFYLRLLPLGSGLAGPVEGSSVSVAQVTSTPARALLGGLADPAVRREGPRPMDASGFLSVVSGTLAASDAELGRPGWALISDRYLHMSSRMGYHFTTVEAFVGQRAGDNRIRFVFKGGAADEPRRQRRARFLAGVLEGLQFQVRLKGDLVTATYGHGTPEEMTRALEQLGRLLACAGQLDMSMAQERQVGWYVEGFLQGDYGRVLGALKPPV